MNSALFVCLFFCVCVCDGEYKTKRNVMITAEIHARSLANFFVNMRTDTRQTHEFEIHATRQRAKAGNSSICYRKKQIDVSFNASVLLLTMNFVITLSK